MTSLSSEPAAVVNVERGGGDPGDLPLAGVRVVDASEHPAGQYCTRMMADFGAEVVLVEPPRGSITRWTGPFWNEGERPEDSILFWHLNHGKRSVTLDLAQKTGARLFRDLIGSADIVVASRATAGVDALSAQPEQSSWWCHVEDFEEHSAFGGWEGSELIHQAMSGVMFENGSPEMRPLYGCGLRTYYATGTAAYIASLAALFATRAGQQNVPPARIAVSETAVSMNHCRGTQYWYNASIDRRGDPKSPRMTLKCSDGWIVAFPSPARWRATCRAMGSPDLADDPRFATERSRLTRWPVIQELLQATVREVPCEQVIQQAALEKAIVAKVATPMDLWDDPHLSERQMWESVAAGDRTRPALGRVYTLVDDVGEPRHRPPRLAEHTIEILGTLGVTQEECTFLRNIGVI